MADTPLCGLVGGLTRRPAAPASIGRRALPDIPAPVSPGRVIAPSTVRRSGSSPPRQRPTRRFAASSVWDAPFRPGRRSPTTFIGSTRRAAAADSTLTASFSPPTCSGIGKYPEMPPPRPFWGVRSLNSLPKSGSLATNHIPNMPVWQGQRGQDSKRRQPRGCSLRGCRKGQSCLML